MSDSEHTTFTISPPPPPPPPPSTSTSDQNLKRMGIPDTHADFKQWLHAMKMVARLPGGMPAEFRRKLWLALSDRYLQTKGINWDEEGEKYLSEQWDEDDEELGIQIVKDLHRTGSSLCSGPSGTINQAKLKRVLLGYSRFNPEVGYCQGFNMLGALILQVMDKNEADSIKVMILLIEGLLPRGYFCGSLGGLQTDMAVFRELLGTKLPKLARHLQKLQGPEGAFEPPLTNVFTMQWFLTLFCTCLPIPFVLRIWDLILIEGSDVLLRTALAIWGLLEGRILVTKTADDFYCKMGALSAELVNGNLIDCNSLIQRIVDIGAIHDLHKMREKHLHNITKLKESSSLKIFYSDEEGESDEDSRLAVTATAWGLRSGRRASLGLPTNLRNAGDGKEKMNLDISLLKKQYDKLRERQRQAHIILTAAVARQPPANPQSNSLQVNQLLVGKNAILSNKGKRLGPPQGAVPPIRAPKSSKQGKSGAPKSPKPAETLHWKDMDEKQRRGSLKWREMQKDGKKPTIKDDSDIVKPESPKLIKSSSASSAISNISETGSSSIGAKRPSESSSYSEESDADSSTSTSLCDDDNQLLSASSLEASPMKRRLTPDSIKEVPDDEQLVVTTEDTLSFEFPVLVNVQQQHVQSATLPDIAEESHTDTQSSSADSKHALEIADSPIVEIKEPPPISVKIKPSQLELASPVDDKSLSIAITSTSQLSPIPDIGHYVSMSTISPLRTPSSIMDYSDYLNNIPSDSTVTCDAPITDAKDHALFNVNEDGVTNQLFERINAAERPNKLDLNVIKERKVSESLVNTTESLLDRSDNTSKLENYSFTNVSNRSSMSSSFILELPVRTSLQHDSPLIPPPNAEPSTTVHSEKSPIIQTKTSQKYQIANIPTPSPQECDESEIYLASRIKFLKEKSFSMDDPIKEDNLPTEDLSKRSASEGLVSADINVYKSNKMSEIIKENSLILGRIIRKANRFDEDLTEEAKKVDRLCVDEPINLNLSQEVNDLIEKINNSRIESHEGTSSTKTICSPRTTISLVENDERFGASSTVTWSHSYESSNDKPKPLTKSQQPIKVESPDTTPKINQTESKNDADMKINQNPIPDITTQRVVPLDNLSRVTWSHSYRTSEENLATTALDNEPSSITETSDIVLRKESEEQAVAEIEPVLADCEIPKEADESEMNISKTDLVIKRTEEQLARFKDPEPTYYVRKDNFREIIIPNEEKEQAVVASIEEKQASPAKEAYVGKYTLETSKSTSPQANTQEQETLSSPVSRVSIKNSPEHTADKFKFEASDTGSKTDELIKKTEEQLARFRAHDRQILEKLEKRLSLIDLKLEETQIPNETSENMPRISSKTEEIIKKTDEQLARFKAAAESNAEKRKSRHEIDELLQIKADSPDLSSRSSDSIKLDDISIADAEEAVIIKHAQAEILKTIKMPAEVKCSKTDEIIKRIEDGKLKLGDDYITTIKTIDYLKQSNANLSATLSSIESSIKAIDGFCDHNSEIHSNRINDTIDNLEKSLKQFDKGSTDPPLVMVHDYSSSPHENRCRPASNNRPSRPRKRREYSPRHRKEKDHTERTNLVLRTKDHSSDYSSDARSADRESPKTYTFHSYYSTSPPLSPRIVTPAKKSPEPVESIRPTSFKSTSHDRYLLQKEPQMIKFDKSPSSPIINKSYLESLKPATPIASGRTSRSAENSPPFHAAQVLVNPSSYGNSAPQHQHHSGLLRLQSSGHEGVEFSHIKSCENILMRFDYKNISAIAASFPVSSSTLATSPSKFRSLDFKQDATLNLSFSSSPNKNV
ncbi:serine-rich adhesin for platelets isoform X2 [Culex pipiens pallens]|uniref:serine-rich adhesin for platelets isoform X2 n=1 Tax=Culex pipiens pallens TaxID=42434 RepID=UPI0019547B69|nr:serine-rich adhesin for platelets isoform X2 [Culex pipiens pallens]